MTRGNDTLQRPPRSPRMTEEGKLLTQMRRSCGLRQCDLAAMIGINPGRISEWEQGLVPGPRAAWREIMALLAGRGGRTDN